MPSLALNLNFSLESPQQRWRDILAQSNKVPQCPNLSACEIRGFVLSVRKCCRSSWHRLMERIPGLETCCDLTQALCVFGRIRRTIEEIALSVADRILASEPAQSLLEVDAALSPLMKPVPTDGLLKGVAVTKLLLGHMGLHEINRGSHICDTYGIRAN